MKKIFSVFMAVMMIFGLFSVSFNVFSVPAPKVLTQEIECIPVPNWAGSVRDDNEKTFQNIQANQEKYMEILRTKKLQSDESQYAVPELSTAGIFGHGGSADVAVWQGVADDYMTRFANAGQYVTYKFDLADTATDFSVTFAHMSEYFIVEASKNGLPLSWFAIGEYPNKGFDWVTEDVFPEVGNSTHLANMNTILENNPDKIVYIRLSSNLGGRLIYQSVKITANYLETDQSESWLKRRLTTTPDVKDLDPRGHLALSRGIWDEEFIVDKSVFGTAIWQDAGQLVSFMNPGDYRTYKFKLDPRATDFTVGISGQSYGGFVVEISKDNMNWLPFWDRTENFGYMGEYEMTPTLTSESSVEEVLSANPTKTVYIRFTVVDAFTAFKWLDFSYAYSMGYQNDDITFLRNHLLNVQTLTGAYNYLDMNGDTKFDILDLLILKENRL